MRKFIPATLITLIVALASAQAQSQTTLQNLPIRLTSNAVNMSNIGTGQTATIDIIINRWSGDTERERLLAGFIDKGPDQLIKDLSHTRSVGRITTPGSIGYDLRYARVSPLDDGGVKIVVLTDRPISGWEAINRPRSFDYPFTLIQIQLDSAGTGVGKLSVATKISYDKYDRAIELETFASEPVRLENVHIVR